MDKKKILSKIFAVRGNCMENICNENKQELHFVYNYTVSSVCELYNYTECKYIILHAAYSHNFW